MKRFRGRKPRQPGEPRRGPAPSIEEWVARFSELARLERETARKRLPRQTRTPHDAAHARKKISEFRRQATQYLNTINQDRARENKPPLTMRKLIEMIRSQK